MKTRHASIWVSLTVVLLFIPPAGAHEKTVVGWLEKVWIYPGDVLVHAKLDTGARHSSLNAPEIMKFDRNGEKWVRFTVRSKDGKKVTLERKIHRVATVKRKGASSQKRPVVILGICLGNYFKEVEVNLVDRSGGDGILVISGRMKEMYRKIDGELINQAELNHHVLNILSGIYSLGGQPDKAIIEYRVQFDPVFEAISYQGVPDIRIIVFLGVPVMAMIRLPTRMSSGKANLHQGAIGAGIDIATGRTLTAVWRNEIVSEHPDTGNRVTGLEIPGWRTLLELAVRCFELTGLGYQGVDLVLDKEKGSLVLELNARPGLNIQIANRAGLAPRLELVESEGEKLVNVKERVAFAQEHFGAAS